jgi:hypothetical protein
MSPRALTGVQPDWAETSHIGALAGCTDLTFCAFAGVVRLHLRRPTGAILTLLLVTVLGTDWFDLHVWWCFALLSFDVLEHCAEAFVLGDRRVCDPAFRVLDCMGQDNAFGADANTATAILINIDILAHETTRQIVDLQLDPFAVVLQHEVFSDLTLVAQTENLAQSIRFDVWPAM